MITENIHTLITWVTGFLEFQWQWEYLGLKFQGYWGEGILGHSLVKVVLETPYRPFTGAIIGDGDRKQGGKRPGGETGSPLLIQCVMRRRTGTSAPSALPVILMAAKNFLSTNRKSTFLFLFLSHQWRIFKSLFDAIGPKCNTFKSVVMMLK